MVQNVMDVKKRIELTHGISRQDQRLVFNGKELADETSVTEAGIKDSVTIHLFLRTKPAAAGDNPAPVNQPLTPIMAMADPRLQPPMMPMGAVNMGNMGLPMGPDGLPMVPQPGDPQLNVNVNIVAAAPPVNLSDADIVRLRDNAEVSKVVQIFAVIDMAFLAIWALAAPILFALLPLPICGYIGARRYNKWLLCLYVAYLFAALALRIYWFTIIAAVIFKIVLVVSCIFELFIIWNVVKFVRACFIMKRQEVEVLLLWRAMGQQGMQ